jgi:hypothetical protein
MQTRVVFCEKNFIDLDALNRALQDVFDKSLCPAIREVESGSGDMVLIVSAGPITQKQAQDAFESEIKEMSGEA